MGKKKKGGILGRSATSQSKFTQPSVAKRKPAKRGSSQESTLPNAAQQRADAKASALGSPLQQQCAVIVSKLLHGAKQRRSSGSLKTLCLAPNVQNKRAVYAVVCETLKHLSLLQQILDKSGLCEEHPQVTHETALVLLYDHLVGQGVKPRGPIERRFLSYAPVFDKLRQQLLQQQPGANKLSDLLENNESACEPQHRTARVNLLLTNAETVKAQLCMPYSSWAVEFQTPTPLEAIVCDKHLADVLSLPAKALAHNHPLVESGHVVLQGKSSCMPAHALNPCKGWKVLDCCAAPGNKTTHLAALVGVEGSVIACEKDVRRFETLKHTLARSKASNVQPILADFLQIDPRSSKYSDVHAVLLDPSCSGSGTAATRLDHLLPTQTAASSAALDRQDTETHAKKHDCHSKKVTAGPDGKEGCAVIVETQKNSAVVMVPEAERKRVAGLTAFQKQALEHALSFPCAVRVVYSTCSVYLEENENVVAAVLPVAEAAGFSLMHALPQWHRRGIAGSYPWAEKVVRVHPTLDGMDGFFVAVFEQQ